MDETKPLRALLGVSAASLAGIIATFLFQILTARSLGPSEFGLFAAFLAIVNIGAIGSGALQNSVTVQTAREMGTTLPNPKRKRLDPSLVEASLIGITGFITISALSTPLSESLDSSIPVIIAAALSFPLSFLLARNLGIVQGHGLAEQTVWWSTGAGILRLLLGILSVLLALKIGGFIGAVIGSLILISIWLAFTLKNIPVRPQHVPFNKATIAVFVSTISFAWLTNIDLVFVRAYAEQSESGIYAVLASLVKTGFIIPGTLSLYFLPRFVNKQNSSQANFLPLIITGVGIIFLTLFLWLLGPQIILLLFGAEFQVDSQFVLLMCLSAAPWVFTQTLLIRTNSLALWSAPIVLIISIGAQWILMTQTLPNIDLMLQLNGLLGVLLVSCLSVTLILRKKVRN